jgi:hypothetical protein
LVVILKTYPQRQSEQFGKPLLLEGLVAVDLVADVADHPAEPNAQELQLAPGALELKSARPRMGSGGDRRHQPQ